MTTDALPLTLNEGSHRYKLDGEFVPSVTTIIDAGLPKPALKRWGERVVAEAAVDQLETLGQVLATMGRTPTVDALAAMPYERMKTAQIRGTAVHELAEAVVSHEPVDVPEELADYVRSYVSFLETFDVDVIATEALIANRTLKYAGKLDVLAYIGNRLWLLDIKTSRAVYPETAMQCAAYARAELCISNGVVWEMPNVDAIGVVHVTDGGASFYDLGDIDAAAEEFAACHATWKGIKRRRSMTFEQSLSVSDV